MKMNWLNDIYIYIYIYECWPHYNKHVNILLSKFCLNKIKIYKKEDDEEEEEAKNIIN